MKCDDLFAYTTTRLVVIRDRRLGLLRFALLFSCFVWVVVYQLYVKRGWADETPLSGGSLVLGINPTRNDKGEKHCHCYGGKESPLCGKEECYDDFTNSSDLPYCKLSTLPYAHDKKDCIWVDANNVITEYASTLFMATQIEYKYQEFNSNLSESGSYINPLTADGAYGNLWLDVPHSEKPTEYNREFYITDVEKYTLLIQHATNERPELTSEHIESGHLKSKNREQCVQLYGENSDKIYKDQKGEDVFYCKVEPERTHDCHRCTDATCREKECGYDVYEVRTLLLAGLTSAEVHLLDDKVTGATHTGEEIPFRGHGLTLNVHIVYTDIDKHAVFGIGDLSYYYNIEIFKGPENSHHYNEEIIKGKKRILTVKHGIAIIPDVQGYEHHFNPQSVLVCLTSALGLLSMVTLLVETIMLKAMPLSKYYTAMKYERTARTGSLAVSFKDVQSKTTEQMIELVQREARRTTIANPINDLGFEISKGLNSWNKNKMETLNET